MSTLRSNQTGAQFREAERVNLSPFAALERRCLIWIAERLPGWVSSDQLTLLALVSMAGAGGCFWAARVSRHFLFGVVVCLALNWFGDSLDGTLARVRNQQRPRYGFYVDHMIDCVGALLLFGGLALSRFMSPVVALGVLVSYLLLSIDVYLATYSLSVFRLSYWGVGPTELRFLLAAGAIALRRDPHIHLYGGSISLFDAGGLVAIVCLGGTLLISSVRNVRALYQAEPLPQRRIRVAMPWRSITPTDMPVGRRWLMFNAVGAMGVAFQLGTIWLLTTTAGLSYIVATVAGVEAAILHNFCWHTSWTWAERRAGGEAVLRRLIRFNLTSGVAAIAGQVVVTSALVHFTGVHVLVANMIAIAACSGVNFLLSHRLIFVTAALLLLTASGVSNAAAAELTTAAAAAFDRAAAAVEVRLEDERAGRAPFLWVDRLAPDQRRVATARLSAGGIVVHRLTPSPADPSLDGALLHHWLASVRIAGTSLDEVVALMQRYDAYTEVYRPAVRRSRVITRDGETFTVALQLFARHVISVVLNTDSRATYLPSGLSRMQVRSVGTRIAEVKSAGTADEHEAPIGRDSGFLWRFNNYCALEERAGVVYVQCETLSLTRDTPFGLGWLVGPMVNSIPRESLEFTLDAMRAALSGSNHREQERTEITRESLCELRGLCG